MGGTIAAVNSDFLHRIERIIARTEHRVALSAHDLKLVHGLRKSVAARQHVAWVISEGDLVDEEEEASPLCFDILTYLDLKVASTFRLQVGSGESATLPSRIAFGDVVDGHLRAGRTVVDLTRIATKPEYACRYPELSYLTARVAWLAAAHFGADLITTTCLDGQRVVYERAFGFESLGAPLRSPQFGRAIVCMALDCRANKAGLEGRFPMFRSTEAERRAIFGPLDVGLRDESKISPRPLTWGSIPALHAQL